MDKLYYEAYEGRYQAVQSVSKDLFWGHSPEDEELIAHLSGWIEKHDLKGKKIVEFCCGEGGSGAVLASLGCIYQGYDIAPSAIEKAKDTLKGYPDAQAEVRDLVKTPLPENEFDAALDVMGFHMLVVDSDRKAYLANMLRTLKPGAPAFFFHQLYRREIYRGPVETFEDWKKISGSDYSAPEEREIGRTGRTVMIPLVPGRARNKEDYIAELEEAGFIVDSFMEMGENHKAPFSCSFHVHKPF